MRKQIAGAVLATCLVIGSGCADKDWIDRTLVTVDVTGSWHGKTAGPGGGYLIGDLFLDLAQQGSTVKGTMLVRGTGSAPASEPIEGTLAGDVFRFKNPRGTLKAELTVSGDEMAGTALTSAGRRTLSLRRVESAPSTGTPSR